MLKLEHLVLQRGILFEMELPTKTPTTVVSLTKEEFDTEINKGISDLEAGRVYSVDSVEEAMKKEFGV